MKAGAVVRVFQMSDSQQSAYSLNQPVDRIQTSTAQISLHVRDDFDVIGNSNRRVQPDRMAKVSNRVAESDQEFEVIGVACQTSPISISEKNTETMRKYGSVRKALNPLATPNAANKSSRTVRITNASDSDRRITSTSQSLVASHAPPSEATREKTERRRLRIACLNKESVADFLKYNPQQRTTKYQLSETDRLEIARIYLENRRGVHGAQGLSAAIRRARLPCNYEAVRSKLSQIDNWVDEDTPFYY